MSGYRKAIVEWVDSASASGWQERPEKDPFRCETTGYMVHADKESVVMALSVSKSPSSKPFADSMTIPRAAIAAIHYVRTDMAKKKTKPVKPGKMPKY